VICFVNTYRWY